MILFFCFFLGLEPCHPVGHTLWHPNEQLLGPQTQKPKKKGASVAFWGPFLPFWEPFLFWLCVYPVRRRKSHSSGSSRNQRCHRKLVLFPSVVFVCNGFRQNRKRNINSTWCPSMCSVPRNLSSAYYLYKKCKKKEIWTQLAPPRTCLYRKCIKRGKELHRKKSDNKLLSSVWISVDTAYQFTIAIFYVLFKIWYVFIIYVKYIWSFYFFFIFGDLQYPFPFTLGKDDLLRNAASGKLTPPPTWWGGGWFEELSSTD